MANTTATLDNIHARKGKIELVQINLGDKCNQVCSHCHVGASPNGKKNMDFVTSKKIIEKLSSLEIKKVELTGGTPELNPHCAMLIEELSKVGKELVVRTSLTVLDMPEYSHFIKLYQKHNVRIVASFPAVFEDLMDRQRGKGAFQRSIKVLRKLNNLGYGTNGLQLDLVHNPVGDYLPPEQNQLEKEFKQILFDKHSVSFNNLVAIVNSPINRFENNLAKNDQLDGYLHLLKKRFNPETLQHVMCRNLLSIDYQGHIYDCDFNQALSYKIKGVEDKKFWEIDFHDFSPEIYFAEHCYACTVNDGSSCHGALTEGNTCESDIKESVKEYYSKELQRSADLKTQACCTMDSIPGHLKKVLPYIAEEVKTKYYGCGSPIPLHPDGLKVLDVGCGSGRDSYLLSRLVGKDGFVYGIDMTKEQISVAKKYVEEHTKRFGYSSPNVKFIEDIIENLGNHFQSETLDLAVSNCVINLVEDKENVFRQIYQALKFGGEFYFSDIYADRRIPEQLQRDPVLYGECLGGALYVKDFERMAKRVGFTDPRIISKRVVEVTNEEVKEAVGNITFCSITYRLWKLKGLEDACEDYGHIATYKGHVSESPSSFELDGSHIFERNRPEKVCGNTALMLSETRFKDFFQVTGSFDEHFGLFRECGGGEVSGKNDDTPSSGCC